ncbi:hypothetical protein BB560_003077 [Smittium megazygosporum]|uniref:Uncharacterized protein n=1 Tax=Smittium megazygosporum TaxID=133381 RepID=A0A2T9ZCZ2_9FUNG|nr:hypothetical protein BB560_003077 [Smittium megazygosporum]
MYIDTLFNKLLSIKLSLNDFISRICKTLLSRIKYVAQTFKNIFYFRKPYLCKAQLAKYGDGSLYSICIWCTDAKSTSFLSDTHSYGKGILSRSKPNWYARFLNFRNSEKKEIFPEDITWARRANRKKSTFEPENHFRLVSPKSAPFMEPLAIGFSEALFLSTVTKQLQIFDLENNKIDLHTVWSTILSSSGNTIKWDNPLLINYAVFAVKVLPYSDSSESATCNPSPDQINKDIRFLFAQVRICAQVKKKLLLCYIKLPSDKVPLKIPLHDLSAYKITEIQVSRFNPDQNR